ncbi:hypothetical protein TWF696_004557 [Orbilia brochopaga]|uniref:Uncharacterized protein n=1 Tax=Orbilia brochopaga TaxID=3140254 RepID=A0AAV9V9A9_9PEZI
MKRVKLEYDIELPPGLKQDRWSKPSDIVDVEFVLYHDEDDEFPVEKFVKREFVKRTNGCYLPARTQLLNEYVGQVTARVGWNKWTKARKYQSVYRIASHCGLDQKFMPYTTPEDLYRFDKDKEMLLTPCWQWYLKILFKEQPDDAVIFLRRLCMPTVDKTLYKYEVLDEFESVNIDDSDESASDAGTEGEPPRKKRKLS